MNSELEILKEINRVQAENLSLETKTALDEILNKAIELPRDENGNILFTPEFNKMFNLNYELIRGEIKSFSNPRIKAMSDTKIDKELNELLNEIK